MLMVLLMDTSNTEGVFSFFSLQDFNKVESDTELVFSSKRNIISFLKSFESEMVLVSCELPYFSPEIKRITLVSETLSGNIYEKEVVIDTRLFSESFFVMPRLSSFSVKIETAKKISFNDLSLGINKIISPQFANAKITSKHFSKKDNLNKRSSVRTLSDLFSISDLKEITLGRIEPSKSINITIDVEDNYFPEGHLLQSEKDGYIGINDIADVMASKGVYGTFYFNVYERDHWSNPERFDSIVQYVDSLGHEVGLHSHPHKLSKLYSKQLVDYSFEEQFRILHDGKKYLESLIHKRVCSFRAGGYVCNRDTIRALCELGFTSDSSVFFPDNVLESAETQQLQPYILNGIVEIPITPVLVSGTYGGVNKSKLDINWLKHDEIVRVLNSKPFSDAGIYHFNLMLHSFSFLKKKRVKRDEIHLYKGDKVISPENRSGNCVVIDSVDSDLFESFIKTLDFISNFGGKVETVAETAKRYSLFSRHRSTGKEFEINIIYRK